MDNTIGFIGMGAMASAMLEGILKVFPKEQIIVSRANKEKGRQIAKEKGVLFVENNLDCIQSAKYIILAVKPQMFETVLKELKEEIQREQIIISIAAGITKSDLKGILGEEVRIVRAMPNTPAFVQEAMTGLCYEEKVFSAEEEEFINKIFQSFGTVVKIEEELMNTVICASGSSPAYVYLFIEALADGAVKYGLPRQMAYKMVAQTVLGAAKMVLETEEHPAALKDKVCSPKGTTIAGVTALEEFGFRNAILKATDSCYEKAEKMNKKER